MVCTVQYNWPTIFSHHPAATPWHFSHLVLSQSLKYHHQLHHVLTLASIHQRCRCSCPLKGPPAFKTLAPLCPLAPPPLLPLVCWLVVATHLIAPLLPLVLLMLQCTLSADTPPPVCLLFASWLSCCSCYCTTASSCSLDVPPLPCDVPPLLVNFSSG
jgi:hypothetical protein